MPDKSKVRGQTKRRPQIVFLAAGEGYCSDSVSLVMW